MNQSNHTNHSGNCHEAILLMDCNLDYYLQFQTRALLLSADVF